MRTAGALLSGQLITLVASLLSILIVPRVLGAADFGMFATATAVGSLTATLAVFGTRDFLVKEAARAQDDSANVVINVIVTRIVVWIAVALVLTPLTFWYVDNPTGEKLVLIAVFGVSFSLVGEAALGGLQAHHALGRAVMIRSAITMLGRFTAIAFLLSGASVVGYSLVGAAFAMVSGLLTLYLFWRGFAGAVRLGVSRSVAVLKGGSAFFALEIARIVYGAADVLMLAAMTTASTVGHYNLARGLIGLPLFVPIVLRGAMFPSLSRWAKADPQAFRAGLTSSVRVVLVFSVPASVGLMLLSYELPEFIAGKQFGPVSPVLLVRAPVFPLIAVDTLLGNGLIALDRQRSIAIVGWGAAVINVALNVAAIPLTEFWWSNGAIGAAATTVVTEACISIWMWRALGPNIDRKQLLRVAFLCGVACLPMAAATLLVLDLFGPIAAVAVGIATYAAAALLIGLVTRADLALLRSTFRSREGAQPAA